MSRYNRHITLSEIGQKGQDKLSKAKVLMVGAGGLGCPVLQYLAAAGIGTLGIIDFDIVSESNLQRQILFGTSSLGKNKASAAKQRLQDLNNTIAINAFPEKLTHKNAISLFNQYDIIVDGTDNFATRYLVNDASIITEKPLVYGGIYKFEGQVSVFNYKDGPSYRCLFPNLPKAGSIPNCSQIGVLGVLPGIIGTLQANEVIKIILEIGKVLAGEVLYCNALTNSFNTISIQKNLPEINAVLQNQETFHLMANKETCETSVNEIAISEALKTKNIQFIDVRERNSFPRIEMENAIHIPFSKIENQLDKIDLEKEKIIFCQAGIKSKQAVSILRNHQINNSYSLKEGALDLSKHLETNDKITQL